MLVGYLSLAPSPRIQDLSELTHGDKPKTRLFGELDEGVLQRPPGHASAPAMPIPFWQQFDLSPVTTAAMALHKAT
jgi:hypothetical protein